MQLLSFRNFNSILNLYSQLPLIFSRSNKIDNTLRYVYITMLSKSVDCIQFSNRRLCLHAKIYLSRQLRIHLLSDLHHYSLKSPYPYRLLIIPLIYPSTHAFSPFNPALVQGNDFCSRRGMDSVRLGRQIWQDLVGSVRRCEGEEGGNGNVTAGRKG